MEQVGIPTFAEADGQLRRDGTDEIYYLNPIRSLHLDLSDFYLTEGISRPARRQTSEQQTTGWRTIRGRARLDDDTLAVIGARNKRTKELDFTLHAGVERENDPEVLWNGHIGFNPRDDENGIEEGWWGELTISQALMDAMVVQYRAGRIKRLWASLEVFGAYAEGADYYGQSPVWGMEWHLRPDDDGGSTIRIGMNSIAWDESKALPASHSSDSDEL